MTWFDAMACCRWRGRRDGVSDRLRFDPMFCKMKESRPGLPQREPVGALAADESVYGVRDLTDGMRTWAADVHGVITVAEALAEPETAATAGRVNARVNRGGAWNIPMLRCRSAARFRNFASDHDGNNGLRLVKSLTR